MARIGKRNLHLPALLLTLFSREPRELRFPPLFACGLRKQPAKKSWARAGAGETAVVAALQGCPERAPVVYIMSPNRHSHPEADPLTVVTDEETEV